MRPLSAPPSGQAVTATEFVRNFATHARAATNEPVHIFNHGRPAWSLIAAEDFARLVDTRPDGTDAHRLNAKLDIVLDSVATIIILVDKNLNILRANLAARSFLQLSDEDLRGAPLSRVLTDPKQDFILQAVVRVRDSGVGETFEADWIDVPVRTFQVKLSSFPGGIGLFSNEITHAVAIRKAGEVASALTRVVDCMPGLARGVINMRGVIVSVAPNFSALTGTDEDRIIGLRLAGMFDGSTRGTIADGIEDLLSQRTMSFCLPAKLLTRNATTVPVTVSASSYRDQEGLGAVFLIEQATDTIAGTVD